MNKLDEIIGQPVSARGWCMPAIKCADGTTLSVQASNYHYCTPRDDNGPWTAVEVGFPSVQPPDTWTQYCEDSTKPTDTVYACVPVSLVREFIAEHGMEAKDPMSGVSK